MERICLIAEADPFIARLLLRFAEKGGLQVVHAQIGQDALDLARQIKPAVIILEPELPGKVRGWDIVRTLKQNQETCAIPVIACSWLKDTEVVALVGEVQSTLQKPEIHYEDFVEALKQAGIETGCQSGSFD